MNPGILIDGIGRIYYVVAQSCVNPGRRQTPPGRSS